MSSDHASPAQPVPCLRSPRWWTNWRFYVSVALVLILWPALMYPLPGPMDASLDGSWPGVLQYAHEKGWQFGKDIVFTWGPWGFLNNYVHLGETGATTKILWETLGKLLMAAALVFLIRRLPLVHQVVFTLCFACFSWLFLDTAFLVLISLIVLAALLREETSWREMLVWFLVLSFLGQLKFTYTVFAGAGVASASGLRLLRRQWKTTAWIAGGFPLVYILFWWVSGQNPDNLYPYLKFSLQFSSGYADAMGINEPLPVFLWGLVLALTCGVFVHRLFFKHSDRPFGMAVAFYLAATWFVIWKHGYVRADSHVFGFYTYTLLLAIVTPAIAYPKAPAHWFNAAAVLAVACIWVFEADLPERCPQVAWARTKDNYINLFNSGALPQRWRAEYEEARRTAQLPRIQQEIGDATVDVFNYNQGIALLNNLNYRPRPIYQSYSAYTPQLMARNLKFYQSPGAPEFVLWKQMSIDARYPTTDDALLIPEMPRMYQPVLDAGEYLLLKRRDKAPANRVERQLLLTRSLRLGETLELPPSFERAIWFQARLPLNKLGLLRSFLYKPPLLHLIVKDSYGTEYVWRVLPRIAKEGFLLSPLLETQNDFASFMRGRGKKWIRAIRLEAPKGEGQFWARIWDCAEIRLYALPALEMGPSLTMQEWVEEGITNLAPVDAKANILPETFSTGNQRALMVHAPGSLSFKLTDSHARLSGTFGLRDETFQRENQTNGVDFVVEQTFADGRTEILLKRSLRPLQVATDRGPQPFAVALPPGAGRQLTLRFLSGENDDSRWDWSYLANLQFSP